MYYSYINVWLCSWSFLFIGQNTLTHSSPGPNLTSVHTTVSWTEPSSSFPHLTPCQCPPPCSHTNHDTTLLSSCGLLEVSTGTSVKGVVMVSRLPHPLTYDLSPHSTPTSIPLVSLSCSSTRRTTLELQLGFSLPFKLGKWITETLEYLFSNCGITIRKCKQCTSTSIIRVSPTFILKTLCIVYFITSATTINIDINWKCLVQNTRTEIIFVK